MRREPGSVDRLPHAGGQHDHRNKEENETMPKIKDVMNARRCLIEHEETHPQGPLGSLPVNPSSINKPTDPRSLGR